MKIGDILYHTRSLCPTCLEEIPATVVAGKGGIFMEKTCPQHGFTTTMIWRDSPMAYRQWLEYGGLDWDSLPQSPQEATAQISWHDVACAQAKPVTAALMTTSLCNAQCPVCFTRDRAQYLPSLEACREMLLSYRDKAGFGAPLEFCGGEPTVRKDLPELAEIARDLGFSYIQLNTNGFRLAEEPGYAQTLKDSGITTIYLGFDGITAQPYITKYNRDVFHLKCRAVEHCAQAGLSVVLVPCIIPDSNDHQLGAIVNFAKAHMPTVRGIYLQPVSYFGDYSEYARKRITIPDILRDLEIQTEKEVCLTHFQSPRCEHPQCGFSAYYMMGRDGKLHAMTRFEQREQVDATDIWDGIRKTWLPSKAKGLSIGGMAFMDAWNIDLFRLKRCTTQIIGKDGTLIPLCAKYVTATNGEKRLPGIN